MLGATAKKNNIRQMMKWAARWKASIPVDSLSPWTHRTHLRAPLMSIFILYVSFLCVSLTYSYMEFASTMQANSFNMDTLLANTTPNKNGTVGSISKATSTALLPSNTTHTTSKNVPGDIPRIIHRIWRKLDTNPPGEWINASNSCQEQNPSYIEYVWTDEKAHQFIQSNFAWFLPAYREYRLPLQRVDTLRYFLLWHFGGIYLDPEIGCQFPMEPLLHGTEAIVPESWPYGVSHQLIASKPNHPFVIKVALSIHDIYGNESFLSTYVTAMLNTGSILISRVLANWLHAAREHPDITILPSENFLGMKGSIFTIYESRVPLGDECSISQFVFENPFGWGGAAIALIVMAAVIFGIRTSPKWLRDQTSTSLIV